MSVGIGGSFLGPLFVHTALQTGKLLSSRLLGSLETFMHFELTRQIILPFFRSRSSRMCERPAAEIVSVYSKFAHYCVLSMYLEHGSM